MIREELGNALQILGDRLPDRDLVLLVRRAFGDRSVSFIRGDVEGVTGHPPSVFETNVERWLRIVHPDDRETVLEGLDCLPEREEGHLEYRIVDPEGSVRWLRERYTVRRKAPGCPPEVIAILRDVTFERTIQRRLAGLEREAWKSRRLEAIGTMAGGIAHDFNNLLTVMLAAADLIRTDAGLSPGSRDDLGVIKAAAERGSSLVRQILRFMAERPPEIRPTDVGRLADELAPILRKIVGRKVRLTLEASSEPWPVRADRSHLEQILLNLAANAREAMPGGGALSIVVENVELDEELPVHGGSLQPERYLKVSVRDTGTGMPPDIREQIFEPHFTTKGQGAERNGGFGLSTVLRLLQGYGGGVRVVSEVGRGSEFHVYLPALTADEAAGPSAWATGRIPEPTAGAGRILLVDGDRSVRDSVRKILEADGHSVVVVGSAAEGLQAFDRVRPPFDLLLTDIALPDRSGHDLWRAAERRVRDLPVIFITAYDLEDSAREGVAISGAHLLPKPVEPERLRDAVRRLLEATRSGDAGQNGPDVPEAGSG